MRHLFYWYHFEFGDGKRLAFLLSLGNFLWLFSIIYSNFITYSYIQLYKKKEIPRACVDYGGFSTYQRRCYYIDAIQFVAWTALICKRIQKTTFANKSKIQKKALQQKQQKNAHTHMIWKPKHCIRLIQWLHKWTNGYKGCT